MKKLSLKLLLSSIILINSYASDTIVTTTLGPINLVVNTTKTPTDGNAYNTVTLGGKINIGDLTTGNITLSSSVFNSAVQALAADDFLPLTVNNAGVINAGNVTQLGSIGNNVVSCQSANSSSNPDITIVSTTSTGGAKRNISLNAAGDIVFASQSIVSPSLDSQKVLSIDENGKIFTSDVASLMIFGDNDSKNFITVDNSANQTGILLDTSGITAASNSIRLDAGSNNIKFVFGSSASATYSLLAVDADGNLKKLNSTDPLVIGSLTAAGADGEIVSLGVSGGNTFNLSSSTDTTLATKAGFNIVMNAADHIIMTSSDMTDAPTTTTVLGLNSSNQLVTTDKATLYLLGDNSNGSRNYITVDNSSSNSTGVVLNGALKITGLTGVSALAEGHTAALTIDNNGNVGIVISDITRKENIKALEISDDFYEIEPISYTIKGRENSATEFGFSAQALRGTSCEDAIIWGANGEPVSIDYKSVFVAAISKFFETRKELFSKVRELETRLEQKEETISDLKKEIKELHTLSSRLETLIKSLLK